MSKTVVKKRNARPARRNNTLLIVGGILAVAVVALLIWINVGQAASAPPSVVDTAGRTWGKASAPVTIDEWGDFQCPVCAQADRVWQQLAPKYMDTGKAKVVFHNFAFIGQESVWAAEAASCAQDQGKFWDYANYLYTHQAGENSGAFSINNLEGFAKNLGLNTTTFNSCLESGKYAQAVQQETAEGQSKGVSATPTFFLSNGQKIEGTLPADQFSQLIDSLQH